MKNVLIKVRTSMKFFILVSIATFLIVGAVSLLYKPIYSVTLDGKLIGYCAQKSKLQERIDEYVENGNGDNKNVAFVELDSMPKYDLCLLKRGITTNDEKIFEKVAENGTTYYKYYAILDDNEEKLSVAEFSTAEEVVQGLKDKNSENANNIQIIEKYDTEFADCVDKDEAIESLYEEKKVEQPVVKVASSNSSTSKISSKSSGNAAGFSTSRNMSRTTASLGINLIKPITGTITSRFGSVSSIRSGAHTGLDIGASSGTPVKVAASGTVVWAGYKGSLGNLVVVQHSNGVQTYYGHCSKIYVSSGQTVSQGQTISAVGSTGNSTGPHLHFEIRVNGVAYNPQNYVY